MAGSKGLAKFLADVWRTDFQFRIEQLPNVFFFFATASKRSFIFRLFPFLYQLCPYSPYMSLLWYTIMM